MHLDDIEAAIKECEPDDATRIKKLKIACHPDRHPEDVARATVLFQRLGHLGDPKPASSRVVIPGVQQWILGELDSSSDYGDLYRGEQMIKISRDRVGSMCMKRENEFLRELEKAAKDKVYEGCTAKLLDEIQLKDGRLVSVYEKGRALHTVEQIAARHPKLDGRHAVWMFRRIMSCLELIHSLNICHGAMTPENIAFDVPAHRGVVFDLTHSVRFGEKLQHGSGRYGSLYPANKTGRAALDIHMAARSLDPLMTVTPEPIKRFITSLYRFPAPDSAFRLNDEILDIALPVYGKPQFLKLEM
jgi:serine/threonine protein kinase